MVSLSRGIVITSTPSGISPPASPSPSFSLEDLSSFSLRFSYFLLFPDGLLSPLINEEISSPSSPIIAKEYLPVRFLLPEFQYEARSLRKRFKLHSCFISFQFRQECLLLLPYRLLFKPLCNNSLFHCVAQTRHIDNFCHNFNLVYVI